MFFKNNYNIFDIIVGNNYVTEKKLMMAVSFPNLEVNI